MNVIENNQSSGNLPENPNPQAANLGENIIITPQQEIITYSSINNPLPKKNWLKTLFIGLLVIFFITGGVLGYFIFNNTKKKQPDVAAKPSPVILPSPTPDLIPTISPVPTKLPTRTPTKKPTPTATKIPIPTVAPAAPTATPIPTLAPTSPPSNSASCQIIANPGSGAAPLKVNLAYSASNLGSSYVTGIQWDYVGDGTWDTDMSLANGNVNYTYTSEGVYRPTARLQLSSGQITNSCSTLIGVQPG